MSCYYMSIQYDSNLFDIFALIFHDIFGLLTDHHFPRCSCCFLSPILYIEQNVDSVYLFVLRVNLSPMRIGYAVSMDISVQCQNGHACRSFYPFSSVAQPLPWVWKNQIGGDVRCRHLHHCDGDLLHARSYQGEVDTSVETGQDMPGGSTANR